MAVTVAGGGTTVGGAGAAVVPGLVGAAVGVGPTTSSSPVDRVSGAATLKASVAPPLEYQNAAVPSRSMTSTKDCGKEPACSPSRCCGTPLTRTPRYAGRQLSPASRLPSVSASTSTSGRSATVTRSGATGSHTSGSACEEA